MTRSRAVGVYTGDKLGSYGFGDDHPLGEDRIHAFWDEMHRRQLEFQVRICDPVMASEEQLKLFHTQDYVEKVKAHSETGEGKFIVLLHLKALPVIGRSLLKSPDPAFQVANTDKGIDIVRFNFQRLGLRLVQGVPHYFNDALPGAFDLVDIKISRIGQIVNKLSGFFFRDQFAEVEFLGFPINIMILSPSTYFRFFLLMAFLAASTTKGAVSLCFTANSAFGADSLYSF